MQEALNRLDIPCYHGFTLILNLQDTEMWNKALDAKFFGKGTRFTISEWDQLLGNYAAVTDLPAIAFSDDLIEAYPDAKVVLVERDIEKWYQSFHDGIISNLWSPILLAIASLDPYFMGRMCGTAQRWSRGWMKAHSRQEMEQNARSKYQEHYALVKKVTPKERLLEFDLKDGWGPLCNFLGKPIPDVPFPHTNESAALKEIINIITIRGAKNALLHIAKVLLPLLVAFVAYRIYTTTSKL